MPKSGGLQKSPREKEKRLRIGLEMVRGKRSLICKTGSSQLSLRGSGLGSPFGLSDLDARGRSWRPGATHDAGTAGAE